MSRNKDLPKIIAYSVVIFLIAYFVSFIVSVAFLRNVGFGIFGSIIIALIFVLLFLSLSNSACFEEKFYTEERLTRKYKFKLLYIVFCVIYGIACYAIYVIFSKKIGIILYAGIGLISVLAWLYDKTNRGEP